MKHPLAVQGGVWFRFPNMALNGEVPCARCCGPRDQLEYGFRRGAFHRKWGEPARELQSQSAESRCGGSASSTAPAANTEFGHERSREIAAQYARHISRPSTRPNVRRSQRVARQRVTIWSSRSESMRSPVPGYPWRVQQLQPQRTNQKSTGSPVHNATMHNLQGVTAHVPLKRLVAYHRR